MTGKLIVLSGIDGSGKATQTELLRARLIASGRPASALDFPRYGQSIFGDMIAAYLRGEYGPAAAVAPELASLMYAADRWGAADELRRLLAAGTHVICNRYVCANKAHQGGKITNAAARRDFYRWVDRLEYESFALPRPDLTILLHLPTELARELVARKSARAWLGERKRDDHEADEAHQLAAAAAYVELSESEPGWARVDCADDGKLRAPEWIAEKIWKRAAPLLEA